MPTMRDKVISSARLIIADDHPLVREGMRAMLASEPDFEVIGEAENGQEALELCRELRPDLVLMDVRMPEMDGLEATRKIKEEYPQTSVLMVTSYENPDHLLDAIRAGAAGYLLKDAPKQQLTSAVRRVLEGESPLDQELATQLLRRLDDETQNKKKEPAELAPRRPLQKHPQPLYPESLTAREVEILRLVAQGQTNRQIAQNLSIARNTARNHVQHIIAKLGVSDRTQAAVRAIELGLLPDRRE